jgi:hypothetical protein
LEEAWGQGTEVSFEVVDSWKMDVAVVSPRRSRDDTLALLSLPSSNERNDRFDRARFVSKVLSILIFSLK